MVEFSNDGYQIIEEWTYSDAMENGLQVDVRQAYEAVGLAVYALSRGPEAYPIAHGEVRVLHIEERPLDDLPSFRIFFRIGLHNKDVYLLYVDHG